MGTKNHSHGEREKQGFKGLRQMHTGTQDAGNRSPRARKHTCAGSRGGFNTGGQRPRFTEQATCRALKPPTTALSPQVPTHRMNPVSVVIVSPGTTRCFLVSRPRLSLRGLRATGSLISIAILAPVTCAGAAPPRAARSGSAIPRLPSQARGGASEQQPMGSHALAPAVTVGNNWVNLKGRRQQSCHFYYGDVCTCGINSHDA